MGQNPLTVAGKTALITGAAHRIGAQTARTLHAEGMNMILHYRSSAGAARRLQAQLEADRPGSVALVKADLHDMSDISSLAASAEAVWGRLDALVNNASAFFATPFGGVTEAQWEDLMGSNLKGPFFLCQAAADALRKSRGCIVNLVDIHAERPLKGFPVYSMAKAGVVMMTRALARELGPDVRVNGVAPGAILWPEQGVGEAEKQQIISRTALQRIGEPDDIARTVLFLVRDAPYITGQIIAVDGGRTVQH